MIKVKCKRVNPQECAYFNPTSRLCRFPSNCEHQSTDILEALKQERDHILRLLQDCDPHSRESSYLNGRYGAYREIVEGLEIFGLGDKQ